MCRRRRVLLPGTVLFLKIFEHPARQGAKRLKGGPVEFLLLTQGGELSDQPVMFPVEPLAIRTLAGLFRHRSPLLLNLHYDTSQAASGPDPSSRPLPSSSIVSGKGISMDETT